MVDVDSRPNGRFRFERLSCGSNAATGLGSTFPMALFGDLPELLVCLNDWMGIESSAGTIISAEPFAADC